MRINESIYVEEVINCLLCKTKGFLVYEKMRDRLFGASGEWAIFRCPDCDFFWLNPQPVPDDIGKVYEAYYTHSALAKDRKPKLSFLRKKIKHVLLGSSFGYKSLLSGQSSKWMGRALGLITPLRKLVGSSIMWLDGSRKGKLLDVGCGNGQFLVQMQNLGWEVVGVEPDPEASRIAQEQLGLEIFQDALEKANFPNDFFEAVTLNHVIEHVHDPIRLLRECQRVLKPGGRLVVVTPNIESLGHKAFRASWLRLDPPRHLHLFSLQTLKTCAGRASLQVKTLHTTARSAREMWVASKLIQRDGRLPGGSPKSPGWPLRLGGIVFQLLQHGLQPVRQSIGEELVLIASKSEDNGRQRAGN